jgi:hypothetical protein
MTQEQLIKDFIYNRENTLSVKKAQVKILDTIGDPSIFVGTIPYHSFSKDKKITYVISYGRYLNCEMLCYGTFKKDKSFFHTDSKSRASRKLAEIYNQITSK